jgi:tRNA A-37 threonylcarbamoyl transferase component Bud32
VPAELLSPRATSPGRLVVNSRFRDRLAALGLDDVSSFLDLPGEVVSGHPDRHVVRVEVSGVGTCYLKRQHRVGGMERFRQWVAGFGPVSRCGREAAIIRELEAAGFAAPTWVAVGEHGGRAFLLVEELNGIELRHFLSDNGLSSLDRGRLAGQLGREVATLHAAGFDTPDLTAKHVFVDPGSSAVTLIDWQNGSRPRRLGDAGRIAALAALHASLADELATPRDRLRFLRAYLNHGRTAEWFSAFARRVVENAERLAARRSIRDQRQPVTRAVDQRLVWLAGEAVCAVPDVAAVWPVPPATAPFYTDESGETETRITLPDGRLAVLVRGRAVAPLGRLRAWLRGRPWRSPGVTIGRVLFHLERYGVPAPRLFAFGQRDTGAFCTEWFVLYQDVPFETDAEADYCALLGKLHDSGCRPQIRAGIPFRATGDLAMVADPRSIRIVRRVTDRARRADHRTLLTLLRAA